MESRRRKGNHEDNPTIERPERWVTLPGDSKPGPINIGDEDLSHISNWFECCAAATRGRMPPSTTASSMRWRHHGGAVVLAGQAAVLRRRFRADRRHGDDALTAHESSELSSGRRSGHRRGQGL